MNVRPIEPSDYEDYLRLLEGTSDEDRFCRFFHVVRHFDPRETRRFVESQPDVVGLIAEDGPRKLGVAHGFLLEGAAAEIAVLVSADARRQGVGGALLNRLVPDLRARGCNRIVAYSLAGNAAFASLATAAGLRAESVRGGTVTWTLLAEAA
jgi:GNAT superfamily N-acetyltransferase